MSRERVERWQVGVYFVAIVLGLALGSAAPAAKPMFEALLWPTLAVLLYATFVQVPLLHLREAFADRRFVAATLVGNFLLVPALVGLLLLGLPPDPALRLGVLLVLLMPCTDWFITFAHLGRGDLPRAIAVTPLNLLLQIVLLPVYLWLFGSAGFGGLQTLAPTLPALAIVLVPLALAALSERWIEARPERAGVRESLAWWPVPLLALVVLLIAAAQVEGVVAAAGAMRHVVPVFVAYLVLAALVARALAALFRLPPRQGRTLAFSLGTRNSFVVLPLALLLPSGFELAAMAIVVQSLVELLGMVVYLWWVPRHLFRER